MICSTKVSNITSHDVFSSSVYDKGTPSNINYFIFFYTYYNLCMFSTGLRDIPSPSYCCDIIKVSIFLNPSSLKWFKLPLYHFNAHMKYNPPFAICCRSGDSADGLQEWLTNSGSTDGVNESILNGWFCIQMLYMNECQTDSAFEVDDLWWVL